MTDQGAAAARSAMAHDLVLPDRVFPTLPGALAVPATVADAGAAATRRYVEFFAEQIRNPNTRAAYARATSDFFGWCERHGLALPAVQPVHVAAWVEGLGCTLSAPSVKQRLAAVRILFDWLVVGQEVPHNPAALVRGPLFRTAEGRTCRLTATAMAQPDVYRMIGRRATAAGVATQISCHSWRARGITTYLENGGLLEHAQAMAGHASARAT